MGDINMMMGGMPGLPGSLGVVPNGIAAMGPETRVLKLTNMVSAEELADDEAVAEKFVHKNAYGPYENYLGAEHEDKNPRKTAAAQNRQGAYPEARATAITIRG